MRVNTHRLADITHLITKHNLQRMIRVVHILHHLGHLDVCADKFCLNVLVHLTEYLFCIFRVSTDKRQWRIEIVLHRCTLTQELRVRYYGEIYTANQS